MNILTRYLLVASLGLIGCRKPSPATAPEEKSSPPSIVQLDQTSVPAPENVPPPPSADGTPSEDAAPGPRVQPMDVESLNTVIGDYMASKDRIPKDFNEMVRLKLIPHVPKPPPGYKYEIDQVRGKVIVKKI